MIRAFSRSCLPASLPENGHRGELRAFGSLRAGRVRALSIFAASYSESQNSRLNCATSFGVRSPLISLASNSANNSTRLSSAWAAFTRALSSSRIALIMAYISRFRFSIILRSKPAAELSRRIRSIASSLSRASLRSIRKSNRNWRSLHQSIKVHRPVCVFSTIQHDPARAHRQPQSVLELPAKRKHISIEMGFA